MVMPSECGAGKYGYNRLWTTFNHGNPASKTSAFDTSSTFAHVNGQDLGKSALHALMR